MSILLQWWGGLFYLLAKVLLSRAVKPEENRNRALGWACYLLGVPAWVVLLSSHHDWIAVAVESGGVPTMILGVISNLRQLEKIPRNINTMIKVLVTVLIALGVGYSYYDFEGFNSVSQVLELGVTFGYLIGTYLLANKDRRGWLWFVLMNTSMALLTGMQNKWVFCVLQVFSLYFVISGFRKAKKS